MHPNLCAFRGVSSDFLINLASTFQGLIFGFALAVPIAAIYTATRSEA